MKQNDNKFLFKSLNDRSKNLQSEMQAIAKNHNEIKEKYEELKRLKLNMDKFANKSDKPKKSIIKEIAKKKDSKKTSINSRISKEIER